MANAKLLMLAIPLLLAGCLGGAVTDAPSNQHATWLAREAQPYYNLTFDVQSLGGGPISVAGYIWLPSNTTTTATTTAVLALHGAGGVARDIFGPTIIPGYSMAHRVVDSGRAFVVIDRPGYGASEAPPQTQLHDDHAWVVKQVADQLKTGDYAAERLGAHAYTKVVGLGHSWGGSIAMLSQADHGAFDAVISIGWSHAGFTEEFRGCINGSSECAPRVDQLVVRSNVEPAFVQLLENVTDEPNPGSIGTFSALGQGCWDCLDERLVAARGTPDLEDLRARTIDVPALMILGDADYLIEVSTEAEERNVFASTDDVSVVVFPATGHLIWHHLNHAEVHGTILEWLEPRGL